MDRTLSYTIHLEPAEEGGYVVTVPAIPGVVTEGDTYDEAVAMAKDAILAYVGYCADHGKPIPVESPASAALVTRIEIQTPVSA